MNELIFKPRVAPRNGTDVLITTGVGLLQVLVLIGIPGMIVLAVTRDLRIAMLSILAINTLFLFMSVTKVIVSDEGIRLSRVLGGPRLIAWESVKRVEEAPRRELIVRGWLWPIFPPREFTTSLSSLGHYRIEFGDKSVYFPPKDAAKFVAAVQQQLDKRSAAVA
ncbi:PH domain-containing protein [Massilia sp. H-1]|nr:PH domain-containing protein [Massilia sp. H-1]